MNALIFEGRTATGISAADRFSPDDYSVVTIFGAGTPVPAWQTMLGWPVRGGHSLSLDIRSPGARTIWAARLDAIVREADRAVLIVADGLGCAASAWWARLSPADYVARIAGAVLFAPQVEAPGTLFDSPRTRLPFPSLVIRPTAMPDDDWQRDWGSRVVVSDRQRDGGGIAWRQAQALFQRLTRHVVEHDIRRVNAPVPLRRQERAG